MRFPHGPGGFGMFGEIYAQIVSGLIFMICFVVVVGLLFVLIRFLLAATKAAEIYVAKNSPVEPASTPVAPAPAPTPAPPASPAPAAPAAPTETKTVPVTTSAKTVTLPIAKVPAPRARATKPPTT